MKIETNNNIYIPSIDGKDLYVSEHLINTEKGFTLLREYGDYNLRKFLNTHDYSMELIKLRAVYYKKLRNKNFSFFVNGKEYTTKVINVTFNYANKSFNKIGTDKLIRFGYKIKDIPFENCAYVENNKLIAIQLNTYVRPENVLPEALLEGIFKYDTIEQCYKEKNNATLNDTGQIRQYLYENGFTCDGVHYVRYERSGGSSRVGKCLFIDERLYKAMFKWSCAGLKVKEGQIIDLAGFEAYIALPLSSIVGTIKLQPENILLVDDFESVFKDTVMVTNMIDNDGEEVPISKVTKRLQTSEQEITIHNSIWDGESLIDISAMGEFSQYGMIVLRNIMFKSCAFNTNIQLFFKEKGITDISQLNGKTLAKRIEDIKLITTPSSIKYLKFGKFEAWLKNMETDFGVVKHEKKTHYLDGKMVQTHYQLLNTLPFSQETMNEFLKDTFDYMDKLKTDPAVLRYQIKHPKDYEYRGEIMNNSNEIVFSMLGITDEFTKTAMYKKFLENTLLSYKNNVRRGHVLVDGNYSTLLGNPMELLYHSIGKFDGESLLGIGNIHNSRFEYGQDLLCIRSPHVCAGNILIAYNKSDKEIDHYFNLTDEIICINSIGENILQRLNGADFDSDSILVTNNQLLLLLAKMYYNWFKVPTSNVETEKIQRRYTAAEKADLDIKTSENIIGEIINLSQELNTLFWHKLNTGTHIDDLKELYIDICQLSVMSGIEIDKAKKEFKIDNTIELKILREKYKRLNEEEKIIKPYFFYYIDKEKGYVNEVKKAYKKHETAMDYLEVAVDSYKGPTVRGMNKKLHDILKFNDYDPRKVKYSQANQIISEIENATNTTRQLMSFQSEGFNQYELSKIYNESVVSNILSKKINPHTLYYLITSTDDKLSFARMRMLQIVLQNKNENFQHFILNSISPVSILEENENGDTTLYGHKFAKICKK